MVGKEEEGGYIGREERRVVEREERWVAGREEVCVVERKNRGDSPHVFSVLAGSHIQL